MRHAQYPPNALRYVKLLPSERVMTDPSPPVVGAGAFVLVGDAVPVLELGLELVVLDGEGVALPLAIEELGGFLMTVK